MAACDWCGQDMADLASCEWPIPVREENMSDPLDLDPTVDGGADLLMRGLRLKRARGGPSSAGDALRRSREARTRGRGREAWRETTSTMRVLALAGEASIDGAARILAAKAR